MTQVPLFDHDVDNLAELRGVGDHLAGVDFVSMQSRPREFRSPPPSAGEG